MTPSPNPLATRLDTRSRKIRQNIVRALMRAKRGHIASAFSLVEILRVLYDHTISHDSAAPNWPERDRVILSKGHGCLALYALLADHGYFSHEEFMRFCTPESMLGGHPEHRIPGVEASTGSLGHGPAIGVGFALNAKLLRRPSQVYVVVGDGELAEGSVWESLLSAAKHRLDNFTLIVDYNRYQSYGSIDEVTGLFPLAEKLESFGLDVTEIDGHDLETLKAALPAESSGSSAGRPRALICHTVKGKGVPALEENLNWHHKNNISAEEFEMLISSLEQENA